jgi:hypothetical protein
MTSKFTTDTWIGTADADWGSSGGNWSTGFPTSNSNVVIDTTNALTIAYSSGDTYIVNSLTVGNDVFDMTGGSLTITKTASFADGFAQSAGILSAGGTVEITGDATFNSSNGFAASEGHTVFDIGGEITLANYTLGGYTVLDNARTTNLTGGITLGDSNGDDATIDNKKGATFAITGDFGIAEGNTSAQFINTGTLEKTAGSNVSFIDVDLSDTGAIVVDAATLDVAGPTVSLVGAAISGAGQFALDSVNSAGSTDLIGAGTKITTTSFGIGEYSNGTVVTLGENLAYAGTFYLEQGSVFDLNGDTLTLSGNNTFTIATSGTQPIIDGTGVSTLITEAGGTTDVSRFTLGGTVTWENFGTVGNAGGMQIGDSTYNAATFINEKGGLYTLSNGNGIASGTALDSTFVNDAGATLKNTGGAFSVIGVDFSGPGKIVIEAAGTIEFAGNYNTFSSAISGTGDFEIGGEVNSADTATVAAGFSIASTTAFTISSSNSTVIVTLGENLSYGGALSLEQGPILDLGGFTLTLSGSNSFSTIGGATTTIDGGKGSLLVTARGSTTQINDFVLGGAVDWQNSGTVDEITTFGYEASLTIGDGSFNAAVFTNERGGVYDLLGDVGIGSSPVPNSLFINDAGATFEKTAGSGDGQVGVAFADEGTVSVAAGMLEFQTTVSGGGKFSIGDGTILQFDSNVAGDSVDFVTTKGGELSLYDAPQLGAGIHGFGGADSIYLGDIYWENSGPALSFQYNKGSTTEGVLTVGNGSVTAELTLFGKGYKPSDFHASEVNGYVLITDPTTHAPILASAR